ncbi:endonuclease/exonuclease/phosphatase family protein [Zhouia amylolytica]|uniref:Endonuclease/exonuclease/phosphatase family protein n=1 Tax=Zhouia amylolytica AD3 TaxID=1286632 RepID=W2URP5_9FLAO|nr:endonuclease/exonuclease/phosphatase family protein [Zhouia amylolytica]ETN96624.1 endonuclease/exonuclease/phosphatase family protein [Zhouia amylolytica AD3]
MLNLNKFILALLFISSISTIGHSQQKEKSSLKIMTYNIWNGFDWGKDIERKSNLTAWVKAQNPDVLALQELCGYTEEQLKEDALKWGHEYVAILKTEGYPTGITSNQPIIVKDRIKKPFWHGLLHCETYGIDFYIVHLSPSDADIRLKEAQYITKLISENAHKNYLILGDFNAFSPFDAYWMESKPALKDRSKSNEKYSNLRLGEFDYAVISKFLSIPAIDVSINTIMPSNKNFTFPTPALIGKYNNTANSIIKNRQRIDYIFANPELAKKCMKVTFFNQEDTSLLSDHYPVMAEFNTQKTP